MSLGFYRGACDAVELYAREQARLPAFRLIHPYTGFQISGPVYRPHRPQAPPPVARLLSFGAADSFALDRRADNTWLTLQPLDDLPPRIPDETVLQLLTKRVRFLKLLARLANDPERFPLHPGIDCIAETIDNGLPHCARSFWLRLLDALAPDAKTDLTRNLAAISHSGHGLRLLVSIGMSVSQQGAAQALEYFFTALARDHDNDDADDVAFTETLAACGLTDAPASRPSRPIDMGVTFLSGRVSSVVMTTILEGIARTNNTPSSTTFRVGGLWFESNCTLAPTAAETLGDRLGSQPSLQLDMLQLDSTQNVLPRSLRHSLTSATETVKRVVMSDRDNSISAIASALRATELPSLEQLELECCASEDLAEWLAFGVFHVDSPSHVSSLSLRLPPRRSRDAWPIKSWIARFKAVLRDGISPGVLDSKEAANERLFVKLRATSAIKCAPHEGKKTVLNWSNGDDELEALGKADGRMAVVVPGVGIGWVPTDAIVHRRTEPSRVLVDKNTPIPINQRVTSLTWCDPPSSTFWRVALPQNVLVLSLLAIIGRPLTRLSLPTTTLSNDDVASILNLCPNLTELHISGNGSYDLTPFVDAHEAGRLSKLASLSVHLQPAADGHSLMEQHLSRLLKGDRPSRLTRLGIQILKPYGVYGGHAREVVPMVSVLKSADKLEYIELRVSPSVHNELVSNYEPSKAIATKLAIRKRLALLSVVQAVQHASDAIGRLDAAVLGVVFQYSCDWRLFLLTRY